MNKKEDKTFDWLFNIGKTYNKDDYQEIKFERTITVPKGEQCNLCLYLTHKDEWTFRGAGKRPYCEAFMVYLQKTDGENSCCQNYEKCLECRIRSELPIDNANGAVDLINDTLTKAVKDIIKNSSESDKK